MSRRGRITIVIGGIVLLIAMLALVLVLSPDEDPPATRSIADPGRAEASAPNTSTTRAPGATVTPSLPAGKVEITEADRPREYAIGDSLVRDHRKGNHAPKDIPPSIHPPDGKKIHSNLTNELAQKVHAGVVECSAAVPPEARGTKPRVEGLVVIAIKDKQVTVTKATMELRNVVGASVDAAKQCIEQKALAITHPADEADLESYDLTMTFAM